MSERVVIRTFNSLAEAQIVQSLLGTHGIESFIETDNVAGLEPQFNSSHGVRLFVSATDRYQSEQILQEYDSDQGES